MKIHINNDYSFNLYYLFIGIGFLFLLICYFLRRKKYNLTWCQALIIGVLVEISSILGAKLLFIIENINYGATMGVSFYGVILFMPIIMIPVKFFFRKLSFSSYFNFISIGIPIELAVIKIGCLLCGCCVGISSSWGVSYVDYVPNFYRFPVQLLECFIDVLIASALLLFEKKNKFRINLFMAFLFLYGLTRFGIEFLRFHDETRLFFGWLSYGMIWSMVCVLSFAVYMIMLVRKEELAKID